MAQQKQGSAGFSRKLKLGAVKVIRRDISKAKISVDFDGFVGGLTVQAVDLAGQASKGQGFTSKPTHFEVADAEPGSLDVIIIPTMEANEDHIPVEWTEKGRNGRMNLAKLLALKQIQIPAGTRMEIELTAKDDSDFGPAILLRLKDAAFIPKKKGPSRKKKVPESPATGSTSASTPANVPAAKPVQTPAGA